MIGELLTAETFKEEVLTEGTDAALLVVSSGSDEEF